MTKPLQEVESGDGRRFTLREVDPGDMLDLIEAAGVAASSAAWMRYALMICSVSAIDGKPVFMPHTKDAVRELGRKIGLSGMEALSRAHYAESNQEAGAQEEMEGIKN